MLEKVFRRSAQRQRFSLRLGEVVLCLAALVQGVLEELTRTGPQRRHAAKVMLDSLLNALASMHPQDEEDAQLRQAHQAAVQVCCQQRTA